MSLIACAGLVERGDPDRFLAVMAAPPAARRVLFPLYAFNVEVARAPWVTQESMIAEMRLQWWRDAVDEIAQGQPVRQHEVTTPLADAVPANLADTLDQLIAARRWDIYTDPFESLVDFDRYIDQTSGTLLWVAARALGAADETTVRHMGYAQGVANWLRAIPALEARGRIPLVEGTPEAVQALADIALERLHQARANRAKISTLSAPALLAAWEAAAILRQARDTPSRVSSGGLGQSPARKRLSLMLRAASGRW